MKSWLNTQWLVITHVESWLNMYDVQMYTICPSMWDLQWQLSLVVDRKERFIPINSEAYNFYWQTHSKHPFTQKNGWDTHMLWIFEQYRLNPTSNGKSTKPIRNKIICKHVTRQTRYKNRYCIKIDILRNYFLIFCMDISGINTTFWKSNILTYS